MILARDFDDLPAYCLSESPETQSAHVADLLASGARPTIDHDALRRYLLDWSAWGELFQSIRPLLPGTRLEVSGGQVRVTQQFPEPVSCEWLKERPEALVPELRRRLLRAAEWAVGNARFVGVLVGGIDSSGILGALAQVIPTDRIRALSYSGEPGDGDTDPDVPYVEDLCRRLGVKLITDPWTADRCPMEDALLMDARPAYTPYQREEKPWRDKLFAEGVDVILTAGGGDALFGGSFDELGARIARAPVASIRALCANVPWTARARHRAYWVAGRALRRIPRKRRMPRYYGPRLERAGRWAPAVLPVTPESRIRDWYTSAYVQTGFLGLHALTQGTSVPCRDVVMHSELVRFLASIPIETLNCDGRFRGLYHRAIAPWVSWRVSQRRTKSYHDPFRKLLPTAKRALRELARGERLEQHGYVDGARLLEEFDRGNASAIWRFLTTEAWLRTFS